MSKDKDKKNTQKGADSNNNEMQENSSDGGDATQTPEVDQKTEEMVTPEEPQIDPVTDLKQQLDSMSDRYLRLMAEFDNFKKRASRDYERIVDSANEKMTIDLIEVRENFDRALRSAETGSEYQVLLDGIKLIFSKFDSVLSKHGIEVFAEPGDVFDPQNHDALMKTAHPTIPEDHIADVYEKGYRLKGRVIKHAKVIVSNGKPPEQAA